MAISLTPSDSGVRLAGAGLHNGPVQFLIVTRVRRASAGGEGSGHLFSEQNGSIRLGTRNDTTLNLISSRLGTNDNQMRLTVPASGGAPITLAILRGDTPGAENSRHAYFRDGAAASFSTVDAGVSFQSATGGDTGVGFRFGRNQGWDGAIEYLWIWRDVDPTDDLMQALSAGLHPALSGLPRPALAAEFPGSVRMLTGQSIVSIRNSGYSALGGYTAWPSSPLYLAPTAALPSVAGSGSATTEPATGSGTATVGIAAAGTATAPTATGVGAGTVGIAATGAATTEAATASGTGAIAIAASGSATAPSATGTGTGTVAIAAAGTATASTAIGQGTGTTSGAPITGTGAATTDPATGSGTGSVAIAATGSATTEAATASGAATVAGGPISATGAATTDPATGTGAGTVAIAATGSAAAEAAIGAGTGGPPIEGIVLARLELLDLQPATLELVRA